MVHFIICINVHTSVDRGGADQRMTFGFSSNIRLSAITCKSKQAFVHDDKKVCTKVVLFLPKPPMSTYIHIGFLSGWGAGGGGGSGGHLPPLGYAESSTLHANKVKPL